MVTDTEKARMITRLPRFTFRWVRGVLPVLVAIACAVESPPTSAILSPQMLQLSPGSAQGCGVAILTASSPATLISIDASRFPARWRQRAAESSTARRLRSYAVVAAGSWELSGGRNADAVCAFPVGVTPPAASELLDFVRAAIHDTSHFSRGELPEDSVHIDLATAALFASISSTERSLRWSRWEVGSPSIQRQPLYADGLPQQLTRWVITATPNGNWLFDMRTFAALWAALLKWNGSLAVELVTSDGTAAPCAMLSETWHELDAFKSELLAVRASLLENGLDGQAFDAAHICPDSLMEP